MTKKLILLFILTFCVFSFAQESDLKKEIKKVISKKKAKIAVSITSFEDGFELNINGNKKLPMQSVFKFHIALAVLDKIDKGEFSLNQRIFLHPYQMHQNTWSPLRERFPKGNTKFPISETIKYAVAQSDNNACDILLKLIGGTETVQKFINTQGIKDFSIKFNEEEMHKVTDFQYHNYTTTNSLNQLLKKFYEGKTLSEESTDFLMKTMIETSTGKNRLIAQLPKNTIVAHKTGTSFTENGITAATNDAGIVTLPNGKHYAISVFVSDSKENEETNEKIIADISKITFDFLNKK